VKKYVFKWLDALRPIIAAAVCDGTDHYQYCKSIVGFVFIHSLPITVVMQATGTVVAVPSIFLFYQSYLFTIGGHICWR